MKSPFRPLKPPDAAILDNHRPLLRRIERRGILRGGLSLGMLTMLTGCDVTSDPAVDKALRLVSSWNDRVQAALFDPKHLAPTYPKSMILKPPKFNAYYDITEVKPVNPQSWKLELAGLINDKRPWTADRLTALPESDMVIKHICVEGWDYIGGWSGPTLRRFLWRSRPPMITPAASTWRPRCTLKHCSRQNTPGNRWQTPSASLCACVWQPSLDIKIRSGSPPSK
jgi:hypothetical protein